MRTFCGNVKRITAAALALAMVIMLALPVMAFDTIDFSKTGELSVTFKDNSTGKPVSGGSLTLYKVADAVHDPYTGYLFDASKTDFAKAGGDYSSSKTLTSALAAKLAKYAEDNKISGKTLNVGKDGKASADKLKLGLYLVVQKKAADGYSSITPFLVTIPQMDDKGNYVYKVDASPKTSVKANPTKKPTPTKKATITPTPRKRLPQTGQLWWPVFVLGAAGLTCIIIGIAARKKS